MKKIVTKEQYDKLFSVCRDSVVEKSSKDNLAPKSLRALEHALDIRKFEIDLYWKRASYFWVLIGAALIAYVTVVTNADEYKKELSAFVSCLGLVFSCAWLAVNKGSKFWQENWERHTDMLEDEHIGPLYKVVFDNDKGFLNFSGAAYSVSKINLAVSFYVVLVWLGLLAVAIVSIFCPDLLDSAVIWLIGLGMIFTFVCCLGIFFSPCCKSKLGKGGLKGAPAILRDLPL